MARASFISIVSPCYNEEGNIKVFIDAVSNVMGSREYEIILVDDGSIDRTLEEIREIAKKTKHVKYISLSRNFGHQNALWAGLTFSHGDCVISLDSDMQHPVELIPKMLENYEKGYDVVYTIRQDTDKTGFFKLMTSVLFYKITNLISNIDIPAGAADFRLLDRKVVNALIELPENYLFIRGLVAWAGYNSVSISYTVQQRYSGTSKYSLKKMLKLAMSGITSFSVFPLHIPLFLCVVLAFLFLVGVVYVLVCFFINAAIPSWLQFFIIETGLHLILMFVLGILGNYLGLLFFENKRRPNFLIKETNLVLSR